MLYKEEFPKYDDKLYIPKGYEDCSYHNDICPHVEKRVGSATYLLWQDYKEPSKREYEDGDRYIFQIFIGENCLTTDDLVFEYRSDNLDKIKDVMKGVRL